MLTQPELTELLRDVDGWLHESEAYALYEAAQRCTRGVIVELGSYEGRSTISLAKGAAVPFYAVDPLPVQSHGPSPISVPGAESFDGELHLRNFYTNLKKAGVRDIVTHLRMTSLEAAGRIKDPVSLLFIDALHDYENVKADYDAWVPKVLSGGMIAFHDYYVTGPTWPGVRKLVDEVTPSAAKHWIQHTVMFLEKK
jgi:predicted O-methyltransferase YrrM